MNGAYKIHIKNQRISYDFEINSNLTIIRGDSASGKTTLYTMVSDFKADRMSSGVEAVITPNRDVIAYNNVLWEEGSRPENTIIFIDEHFKYLSNHEFNAFLNTSNNYFIIADRDDTGNVDYGIKNIYEIHNSGKYSTIKRRYTKYYDIINENSTENKLIGDNQIDTIITEDSNLGCVFYKNLYCKETIGAGSNSKIEDEILNNIDKRLFIVVDGSAFGKYIQSIDILVNEHSDLHLFIPESFEYLLLKAGILNIVNSYEAKYYKGISVDEIIDKPEDFIDITLHTPEQFFTDILEKCTSKTRFPYNKSSNDKFYVSTKLLSNARKIIPIITGKVPRKDVNKMNIHFKE